MIKKNIETIISEEALKLFCIDMKDNIVGCEWYDTNFCQKTCKFYEENKEG